NFIDGTNMGAQYKTPNQRVTLKQLPLLNQYFSSSFLRAPLAPASVFAYEQLMDELAVVAKMDPVAFRLQNMTSNASETQRGVPVPGASGKPVLPEVARASAGGPKVRGSPPKRGSGGPGRGSPPGVSAGTRAVSLPHFWFNRNPATSPATHL